MWESFFLHSLFCLRCYWTKKRERKQTKVFSHKFSFKLSKISKTSLFDLSYLWSVSNDVTSSKWRRKSSTEQHHYQSYNWFVLEHKGLDPGSNLIRIQPILMPLTFMETIAVMLVTFVKVLMADWIQVCQWQAGVNIYCPKPERIRNAKPLQVRIFKA